MDCPRCKGSNFEAVTDEVDIGVGIQEHVIGGECQECGPIFVCDACGGWDDKHYDWCATMPQAGREK